ncbi:MAG TPA: hypothetical protein VFI84_03690 [Candidatus Saccharimonadales bacterium]|nr:hypothetical protein [Candidatus Saccharimonadales bacterium]
MKTRNNLVPLWRAVTVMAVVVVIVTGVTFAALQSQQAVLTGNTIETASADLRLSTDGTTYSNSLVGFDFSNVVPGGSAVPAAGYNFYLKNFGGTPLLLKFSVTGTVANPDNVDLAKVNVILNAVGSGAQAQTFTLSSLIAAASTGGLAINTPSPLMNGTQQKYALQVSMASDAFNGSSASLGNISFAFGGLATN